MEKKSLELRMYMLTLYNISPIQQGIQSGHACMEYALKYWDNEQFQDWAKNWKTWIILNGGTSSKNNSPAVIGTMEKHIEFLRSIDYPHAEFHEPDLNYATTAVAFLVDERVFNKELYPDMSFEDKVYELMGSDTTLLQHIETVGGKKNYQLREWLKQFRMA